MSNRPFTQTEHYVAVGLLAYMDAEGVVAEKVTAAYLAYRLCLDVFDVFLALVALEEMGWLGVYDGRLCATLPSEILSEILRESS